ncbi:AzlD domain-containing protein [Oenococcus kitaharae]|uniref:AzlD domain-containing protein n=1 Tax=Oenococcus TaxID=46254 RepID=UPI0021E6E753|nr:AzlD domain-containing protein [Oenococcus kitaharae]MCV3296168.1 AzlD domain-containing protein [Oenococcus kitaharae]
MPSLRYVFTVILGCALATWLSRVVPFIILKKFRLPNLLLEFLNFVPIVIMSSLWFESLFTQRQGQLPLINLGNFLASIPTIAAAIISKSLLVTVLIGVLSLAILNIFFGIN